MRKSKLIVMIMVFFFGNVALGQNEVITEEWTEGITQEQVGGKSSPNIQSLAGSDVLFGGYGGPEVRATEFAGKWGVLIGGRGGFLIGQTFTIGLVGAGFANKVNRKYFDGGDQSTSLNMGYGGLFFEYVWGLTRLVHFSIPLDLVAVGVSSKQDDDDKHMDNVALFAMIPRLDVDFNVTSFFIISLSGGYRFAFGESSSYVDQWDVWGPEVGLVFKFGKF